MAKSVKENKPKNMMETFKRTMAYFKEEKIFLIGIFICIVGTTLGILFATRMIGVMIDEYIVNFNLQELKKNAIIMLIVYAICSVLTWFQNYWLLIASENAIAKIRNDIFAKFQKLPLTYFDNRTFGEIMSRVTNDVDNISNSFNNSISQFFQSILTLGTTLIMMFYLNFYLACASLISIPIVIVITKYVSKKSKYYYKEKQEKLGLLNGYIEEIISGQKVVKTFSKEEKVKKDFNRYNEDLLSVGIFAEIYSGVISPLMNGLTNMSYILVVVAGSIMIALEFDGVTIGLISNFILYSRQYTKPVNELASQVNTMMSAFVGAERVYEVLDEIEEKQDKENAIDISKIDGNIYLKDVSFSYDKEVAVLENINLYAKAGQTVALVGATGAGKTTIINLINRFYDIDNGIIEIDGNDVSNLKRRSIRTHIGVVLQDTYLFTESIMENIRYGRLNALDSEVIEVAKLANAHEFIMELPNGYDFILSENGNNLSQGQRQMLGIARAILANPSVLILDEATSNVDTKTELKIQKGMENLMKGRTNFVIAHRLNTIENANVIAVINEGKVVEKGTHEELMAIEGGRYFEMYTNQVRS